MKHGRVSAGHPVDVASGTQFTAWEDIEIPGIVPLLWRRYYSTAQIGKTSEVFGRGWSAYFEMTLSRDLEGYRFTGPDGEVVFFDDVSGSVETGGSALSPGDSLELRREGQLYVIYHWHTWEDDVTRMVFQPDGSHPMLLDSVGLPSGHCLTLRYDSGRRLKEVRQSVERRRLLLGYDSKGLMVEIALASPVSEPEIVARYEYDDRRRLVAVYDRTGTAQRYKYDARDLLVQETQRTGAVYRMRYDSTGRCVEVGGADGYEQRQFEYHTDARTTVVTDGLGHRTLYSWNDRGQVEKTASPSGAVTLTEFDEFGRVVAEIGPTGATTRTAYDAHGNVAAITSALGAETRFEYNSFHQPTRIEQGGAVWSLTYDRGAVISVTDPSGSITACRRDEQNLIDLIQTPSGNSIRLEHNPQWTEEVCRDDLGLVYRKVLDRSLNVLELHDARGLVRTFSWDNAGYLDGVVEVGGGAKRFERDAEGRVVKYTDPLGHPAEIEYSPYSDIVRVTDPQGRSLRFGWDTEGRLLQVLNPKGERGELAYDAVGNVIRQEYFDGRVEAMEYDAAGRMIRKRKADGVVLEYAYDPGGNLTEIRSNEKTLIQYAYDSFGLMVAASTPQTVLTFAYDECGRVATVEQNGRKLEYRYHGHGDVAQRTFDGAMNGPLGFDYDKRGRLTALRARGATLERYEHDAADLLIRRQMGPGVESLAYDFPQRSQTQTVSGRHGEPVVKREYRFDRGDNLVSLSDSLRGSSEYLYDASGNLVESIHSRTGSSAYFYDENGNLLAKAGGQALEYGKGNRLLRMGAVRYGYDSNGNLISIERGRERTRLEWDELDQLTGVYLPDGAVLRFGYDALGRRTWREVAGERSEYFWSGDDLLCELTAGQVLDYAVAEFMPYVMWRNGRPFHVITAFGSAPHELLDADGNLAWWCVYDDWGQLIEESVPGLCGLRLAGQNADPESRLHYNRFRYYDPETGRFVSADPYGWYLPDGANEYLYAPDPVNWEDPLGLTCGKKKHKYSVYVLTKGQPPPGKVVYVGITKRTPKSRLREHSRSKDKKGKFDNMYVIDQGLTRRQARNLEGSALHHVYAGNVPGILGRSLINNRNNNGKGRYTHSYTSNPGRGRQLLSATDVTNKLTPNPANLVT